MDWSKCPDVESVPDRLSRQWVLRDTRIPVQALIDNAKEGRTSRRSLNPARLTDLQIGPH
jgi:uncharacterized protein (DUF433 family)